MIYSNDKDQIKKPLTKKKMTASSSNSNIYYTYYIPIGNKEGEVITMKGKDLFPYAKKLSVAVYKMFNSSSTKVQNNIVNRRNAMELMSICFHCFSYLPPIEYNMQQKVEYYLKENWPKLKKFNPELKSIVSYARRFMRLDYKIKKNKTIKNKYETWIRHLPRNRQVDEEFKKQFFKDYKLVKCGSNKLFAKRKNK